MKYLPELLTHDLHAFSPRAALYYRPVQSLSYFLDHLLFGWGIWKFHLTSLLLHILAACLVYCFSFKIGFSLPKSLLIAFLFGLHPTLTGSVSYISGRADPLAAVWSLTSVLCLLSYIRNEKWIFYGISLFCFALALLSKEIALILPFILFLLIRLFSKRRGIKTFTFLAGYLFLGLLYLMIRFFLLGLPPTTSGATPPLGHLFLFSLRSIFLYTKLLFFPFPLYMERYLGRYDPLWELQTVAGVLLLLTGLLFLWKKSRSPRLILGWGWFWVFLLVNSPLILKTNRYADHVLYFPLIGASIVLVDGFAALLQKSLGQKFWQGVIGLLIFCVITGLSAKTYFRNQDWRDPETFYQSILKHNPKSLIALNNLAMLYYQRGDDAKAEEILRKTIEILPTFAEGYNNLGILFLKERRLEEALGALKKALLLKPEGAESHYHLASAHRLRGEYEEAVAHYQKALSLKPYLIEGHYFLVECYEKLGMKAETEIEREWLLEKGITVQN